MNEDPIIWCSHVIIVFCICIMLLLNLDSFSLLESNHLYLKKGIKECLYDFFSRDMQRCLYTYCRNVSRKEDRINASLTRLYISRDRYIATPKMSLLMLRTSYKMLHESASIPIDSYSKCILQVPLGV